MVYIIVTLGEMPREQAFFPSLAIRAYGLQRRSILRNDNMPVTLYWHDYETFGVDPRRDRPAQFAGLHNHYERLAA